MTTPPSKHLDELSLGFRDRPLSYDELTRQVRGWADAFPDLCRLHVDRPHARRPRLVAADARPRARPRAAERVGRRQHARERAGGLERRARDRRGRAAPPSATGGESRTSADCPHVARSARARRALLRAAADVARRRRGRAHQGPLRALDPARRAPGARRTRTGAARTSTATGSRCRCACATTAASWSSPPRFPGLMLPRGHRRSAAVLQALSRGRHRELRRPQRAVAVFPVRQPDRPQPQLPVLLGARFQAGGRGRVPAVRDGVARGRGLRDAAPRDLPLAQPAHVRRRVHPPARRQARHEDGPARTWPSSASSARGRRSSPAIRWCRAAEEFLYEPDKPLHGDLTDYAYHQRGAVAYVVELWDLFKQAGLERKKRFVDNYTHLTREDMLRSPRGTATRTRAARSGRGARSRIRSWATSRSAASIRASACGIRRPRRCRTCADAGRALPARRALAPRLAWRRSSEGARAGSHAHRRHGREPRLPADVDPRLGEGPDAQRAAVGRRRAAKAASSPIRRGARRDRPSRRLGPRTVQRRRRALLRVRRGTTGARTVVVGRARQGDAGVARRLVPRRLDYATRGRRLR